MHIFVFVLIRTHHHHVLVFPTLETAKEAATKEVMQHADQDLSQFLVDRALKKIAEWDPDKGSQLFCQGAKITLLDGHTIEELPTFSITSIG
jgi:hypothetical protein